jgi:hypothetical protein
MMLRSAWRVAVRARTATAAGAAATVAFAGAVVSSESARCDVDPVATACAGAVAFAAGYATKVALGGQTAADVTEKHQQFWPRKIMILFGPP